MGNGSSVGSGRHDALVDGGGSGILGTVNTGLVGLDISAETETVGNVVDNADATVSIMETVGTNLHARSA
jgi:hypothetical protein